MIFPEHKPQYLQILAEKGWTESLAGNLSFRKELNRFNLLNYNKLNFDSSDFYALEGHQIFISRKGADLNNFNDLFDKNIISVMFKSNQLYSEHINALNEISSEYLTHFYLHHYLVEHSPQKQCILHVHVPEFMIITMQKEHISGVELSQLIYEMLPESTHYLKNGITSIPYQKPGSEALALSTIANYHGEDLIVWQDHGILAVAENWEMAINIIDKGAKAISRYLHFGIL